MSADFDPSRVQGQGLDEPSVQRLKALLDEHAVAHGGMSLEMVDGLFSALIAAPLDIGQEEFLPLITAGRDWPSAEVETEVNELLSRLWNHIGARIEIDPDADSGNFMPLLTFPAGLPDDPAAFADALNKFEFPLGAAWAGGFLHAVNLRLDAWGEMQAKAPALDAGLGFLLRLVQIDPAEDGTPPPPADERVAMMAAMPYLLRGIRNLRDAD